MLEIMPKVMIGCPVRDRAWVLPRYLKALLNLEYPGELREYCFIINDCHDETPLLLQEFAEKHETKVRLCFDNQIKPCGARRGQYSFYRLAQLRNLLLNEFLCSDCEYLFSVDSDILVPPAALRELLEVRGDITSALVWNGADVHRKDVFNILNCDEMGNYIHIREFAAGEIIPVDCTGAAYLIKKTVINGGVWYNDLHGAEDIGFCLEARGRGHKIFCHTGIRCEHILQEISEDTKYFARKNIKIQKGGHIL